jgi:hypothetical protein
VGRKTFAVRYRERTIMKLDKGHQHFLFEVRPETFQKFPMGPNYWSYVELDRLDDIELAELVLEAWSQVVPKKVSRPFLSRETSSPPAHPREGGDPS